MKKVSEHISRLGLLRIGKVKVKIFDHLKKALEAAFAEVFQEILVVKEICEIPKNAYNPNRKQYLMPLFLLATRKYAMDHGYDMILGVTNKDLCIAERDFVVGQAEFGVHAKAAVISLYRLYPKFYKQASNMRLFLIRVVTEAIHELGHVLGLGHCNKHCVMVFSEDVYDIDKKPTTFCDQCLAKLRNRS